MAEKERYRRSGEDQRLSKITDLLVAVQEWECGRNVTRFKDRGEKVHSRSGWTDN